MIASRRPRGRKCSAARMTACSKSGCSNSFTSFALLRLPFPCVFQHGKIPEFKPGKWIQIFPQCRELTFRPSELLPAGSEHGSYTRRLRWSDFEQPLKATGFAEVSEQFIHRVLGIQFTRFPPIAQEVEQRRIRLRQRLP